MTTSTRARPPIWFWIVSILALLWNLLGVMAYLAQVNMTVMIIHIYKTMNSQHIGSKYPTLVALRRKF